MNRTMSGNGGGGWSPNDRNGRESRWGRPSEKRHSSRSRNRPGIFTIGNSENEREEASSSIATSRPGRESKKAYLESLAQKKQERNKKATARRAMGSIKSGIAGSLLGDQEEPEGYFRGRPVERPGGGGGGAAFNPLGLRFGAPSSKNSNWKSTYTLPAPTFSLASVQAARETKEQEKEEAKKSAGSVNNSLLSAFGKMGSGGAGDGGSTRKNRKTRKQKKQRKQRKGTRRSSS
jgi:hypothetical protein